MSEQTVRLLTDPSLLIALLVGIAVFATIFTVMPALGGNPLRARMKSVALERDELRARQRARLAAEADRRRKGLREQQSIGIRNFVERLDLKRALVDEATLNKLKVAGFRGQNPLNRFLFFRFVLPFVFFAVALFYLFFLGAMPEQPFFVKVFVAIAAAYAGFYAPVLYVTNKATKRKQSIQRAWPDALDLMLICVESGMSVEVAMRRVADEIGTQSGELAEELILTNAELSYLPERRQAFENLSGRTGLESVKSVMQALIQAERYGTPVGHALRVLASESRDMRMNEAEKKAAALPPKLTVPMILFFLPVLFAVILGPAGIQVSERGIWGESSSSSSR
ncbi:type II secretion system F family protein [Kumtagia ephedrae]|jgi:tight adherence protein C|uniref:Type II secretion system protein n=1 Tax=Kumtagia ephedrae TaxID=2116701 RepID=A0A2P7S9A4_9HYPH|nr:type II secretion system F family protein [Mesorhizobium ephedrae]PSJ59076.1 type II secretion system protein [Mesorhizobium ephedrae]